MFMCFANQLILRHLGMIVTSLSMSLPRSSSFVWGQDTNLSFAPTSVQPFQIFSVLDLNFPSLLFFSFFSDDQSKQNNICDVCISIVSGETDHSRRVLFKIIQLGVEHVHLLSLMQSKTTKRRGTSDYSLDIRACCTSIFPLLRAVIQLVEYININRN